MTISDSSFRCILWVGAAFNFGGAYLFAFPEQALGRLIGLPLPVPGIYCALLALLVALFGASYAWNALQLVINRPLVGLAVAGKVGVFSIVTTFWIAGSAPGIGAVAASGDLIFAMLFARWLWARRSGAADASRGS